jgi:hypothetical protein
MLSGPNIRERRTIVFYSKPQLIDLGDTNRLIRSESCPTAKQSCVGDVGISDLTDDTAYEADE